LLFYRLKQAHELRKFGFSVGTFEDFLQNFEKEESASELFWKKVLYCSLFAVLALILSPVILSTSWWYLPQQISYSKPVLFILSLIKGVLVTIAFLLATILAGAAFWLVLFKLVSSKNVVLPSFRFLT